MLEKKAECKHGSQKGGGYLFLGGSLLVADIFDLLCQIFVVPLLSRIHLHDCGADDGHIQCRKQKGGA